MGLLNHLVKRGRHRDWVSWRAGCGGWCPGRGLGSPVRCSPGGEDTLGVPVNPRTQEIVCQCPWVFPNHKWGWEYFHVFRSCFFFLINRLFFRAALGLQENWADRTESPVSSVVNISRSCGPSSQWWSNVGTFLSPKVRSLYQGSLCVLQTCQRSDTCTTAPHTAVFLPWRSLGATCSFLPPPATDSRWSFYHLCVFAFPECRVVGILTVCGLFQLAYFRFYVSACSRPLPVCLSQYYFVLFCFSYWLRVVFLFCFVFIIFIF